MRFHRFLLAKVLAVGCSHPSAPPAATPSAQAQSAAARPVTPRSARELPLDAVYADLVRAIAATDGIEEPTNRCLLARSPGGFRYEGQTAVAMRPLPSPALDMDLALEDMVGVRVLSRYGNYGESIPSLALVSLTDTPPTPHAVALLVTDRAFYARDLTGALRVRADEAFAAVLALEPSLRTSTVHVASEAQVPLERVEEALRALSRTDARVALALPLERDVSLPAPSPKNADAPHCPEGLEATDAMHGDLSIEELQAGIESLRASAPDCLERASGAGAAGGRLTLALRIDANGGVSDACIVSGESQDAALESCVLGLARALRFAPPSPRGVVDAELPLALRPHSEPAQAALCPAAR